MIVTPFKEYNFSSIKTDDSKRVKLKHPEIYVDTNHYYSVNLTSKQFTIDQDIIEYTTSDELDIILSKLNDCLHLTEEFAIIIWSDNLKDFTAQEEIDNTFYKDRKLVQLRYKHIFFYSTEISLPETLPTSQLMLFAQNANAYIKEGCVPWSNTLRITHNIKRQIMFLPSSFMPKSIADKCYNKDGKPIPSTALVYANGWLFGNRYTRYKGIDNPFNYLDTFNGVPIGIDGKKFCEEEYRNYFDYLEKPGFTWMSHQQDLVLNNVGGWDIRSSYSYSALTAKIPVTPFTPCGKGKAKEELMSYNTPEDIRHCYVVKAVFKNLRTKTGLTLAGPNQKTGKTYSEGAVLNSAGKILTAKKHIAWLTEIDFLIYKMLYTWDFVGFTQAERAECGEVPPAIQHVILKYADIKFNPNKYNIIEQKIAKNCLECIYGAGIPRLRNTKRESVDGVLTEVNNRKGRSDREFVQTHFATRYISPQWAMRWAALSRYNLLSIATQIPIKDYQYSDTDSIYVTNPEKYEHLFKLYNEKVTNLLRTKYPEKPDYLITELGHWQNEALKDSKGLCTKYTRFKFVSGKHYCCEYYTTEGKQVKVVASGVGEDRVKKAAGDRDIINDFDEILHSPEIQKYYLMNGFLGLIQKV